MRNFWKRLDVIDLLTESTIDQQINTDDSDWTNLINKIQEFRKGDQNKKGWRS